MPERRAQALQDHDILIEVKTKVDILTEKIDSLTTTTVARVDAMDKQITTNTATLAELVDNDKDKESRLRFLEKYVWGAVAVIGILNFIGLGGLILLATKLLNR